MNDSVLKPTTNSLKRTRGRPKTQRLDKDLGTKELQQKRQFLYGDRHEQACKSSPSLDLLYHHRVLTEQEYEAGKAYYRLSQQALQGMVLRPKNTSCLANLDNVSKGNVFNPEDYLCDHGLQKLKQWRRLEGYLKGKNPLFPNLLYQLIIKQQLKKAFFMGGQSLPELKLFKKGLEALYLYLKTLSFKQNL